MMLLTQAHKMKLIDNHIVNAHTGEDACQSANVVVHLFNPDGRGDWYLSELDPVSGNMFGICCISYAEYGNVNIADFEKLNRSKRLGIERDYHFPINKHSMEWCMDYAKQHKGYE